MTSWKPARMSVFCHSFRDLTGNPHMNMFFFVVSRKFVLEDTTPIRQAEIFTLKC